jgi:thymidylate synthase (FAD)
MKLIKSNYSILTKLSGIEILKKIERIGRIAYKSEDKITENSARKFISMVVELNHLSVIEHQGFSVKFIIDRGISHELVRHRLSSFTQESSRYCNYNKDKFDNQVSFIDIKPHLTKDQYAQWLFSMETAERDYQTLIQDGCSPQFARSVLPNSLKTEIIVSANLREWRTIFKQRTAGDAHPQIREVMRPLLDEIKGLIPIIFDDINYE